MKKILLGILFIFMAISFNAQSPKDSFVSRTEFNNAVKTMQDSIKQIGRRVDNANDTYKTAKEIYSIKNNVNKWFGELLLLFLTITGFVGYKLLNKYIKQKFENILLENEKTLVDIVRKHQRENELLSMSKIMIINKFETEINKNFLMILNKFKNKFTIVNTEDLVNEVNKNGKNKTKNRLNKSFKKYDAIILDNFSNQEDMAEMWDFKQDNELKDKLVNIVEKACENDVAFLYFGDGQKDGGFRRDAKLKQYGHLIGFANQPSTLYSNLIDLLDYIRLIKR